MCGLGATGVPRASGKEVKPCGVASIAIGGTTSWFNTLLPATIAI